MAHDRWTVLACLNLLSGIILADDGVEAVTGTSLVPTREETSTWIEAVYVLRAAVARAREAFDHGDEPKALALLTLAHNIQAEVRGTQSELEAALRVGVVAGFWRAEDFERLRELSARRVAALIGGA